MLECRCYFWKLIRNSTFYRNSSQGFVNVTKVLLTSEKNSSSINFIIHIYCHFVSLVHSSRVVKTPRPAETGYCPRTLPYSKPNPTLLSTNKQTCHKTHTPKLLTQSVPPKSQVPDDPVFQISPNPADSGPWEALFTLVRSRSVPHHTVTHSSVNAQHLEELAMSGQSDASWQIPVKRHCAAVLGIQELWDSHFPSTSSTYFVYPFTILPYLFFFPYPSFYSNITIENNLNCQIIYWKYCK